MKKYFLFFIICLVLPCFSLGATGTLSGHCQKLGVNADDSFLVGLGNNSSAHNCFDGINPDTDTTGMPVPYAATVNKLYAVGGYTDSGTSPATFNVLVQVYVNGVASSLSCTVVLTGGTLTPLTVSCNNTTTVLTVAAGDIISVKISSPGIRAALGSATAPSLGLNAVLNLNKL